MILIEIRIKKMKNVDNEIDINNKIIVIKINLMITIK